MSQPRLIRTMTVTAVAILSTLLTGTAAVAAGTDRTPPTAPVIGYAEGFQCLTVILGAVRSTDNVTPQSQLRYQAFADGVLIGSLTDRGQPPGPWGVLQLKKAGPNTVTVQAIDAAGNRSALSNTEVVTGYYTPGCTPWNFG
jgi:hypothetical protein